MSSRLRASLLWLTLLAGLFAVGGADADNWPRFRGPNGAGVSTEKGIPVQWTPDNMLWKTALPGVGHSSPIVWGDRLFMQSSSADAKQRMMLCVDANSGKLLWSKNLPGNKSVVHKLSSYASGTPATDGERVYAAFWDGDHLGLQAYDFYGQPLWHRDLGAFKSQHGAGHSPIVWQDRVILANDQDGLATLACFDAKSGDDVWKVQRKPFRACYSTPILHEAGGKVELLVASTAGVTSYNPADGKQNWTFDWKFTASKPLRTVASPVIADGVIVLTSGDGDGSRCAIGVKLGGAGDVSTTNFLWENRKTFPYVPCSLALGEHIYAVNDAGLAACYVAKTGEEVWNHPLRSGVTASPLLIDGKIYVFGDHGKVFVFEAKPKFKMLAGNDLADDVSATPAVANHRLYVRGKEFLYCIGEKK